jgi:DNA-directed RNA polymerase subunit F
MKETTRTAEFRSRLVRILDESPHKSSEIRIIYAPQEYLAAAREFLRRDLEANSGHREKKKAKNGP